jgi:hypothetical protein
VDRGYHGRKINMHYHDFRNWLIRGPLCPQSDRTPLVDERSI